MKKQPKQIKGFKGFNEDFTCNGFKYEAGWEVIDNKWQIKEVKSVKVDGIEIKPDVWYQLKDRKIVESK
jgi:hypothetical protein